MWRICETCAHSAWRDGKTAVTEVCLICTFGKDGQPTNWKEKPMTNADRIRAMSDEELLNILSAPCPFLSRVDDKGCPNPKPCRECIAERLKQPAEEET